MDSPVQGRTGMAAGVVASRGDAALSSAQLLLAAAWTGALWTVGALVAPGLFAALPDRVLAGTLAGRFFTAVGWLGLGAGAAIVVIAMLRGVARSRFAAIAVAMWLCSAVSMAAIQPEVARLRDAAGGRPVQGTDLARPFAIWHAASSIVFLAQGLLGVALLLSWRRHAEARR